MAKCKAKNSHGEACKMAAVKGDRYCFNHSPARAAERAASRKRGGEARHTPHFASADDLPSQAASVDDVNRMLRYVWDETAGMDNSVLRNRLLLACCEAFYKSIEIGELAARIAALEALRK